MSQNANVSVYVRETALPLIFIVGKCRHLTLMWRLVNVMLKFCVVVVAYSLAAWLKKQTNYCFYLTERGGWGGSAQDKHPGKVDFRAMVALLRQEGLLKREAGGSSDWGVWETVGFLTPSTVPYGSPIRFHWKNRVRPEEQPLPQCVHTSPALALPPWGPARPSGPHWTCTTPPKRKRDCSPKGRNYCKDLAL